MSRCNFHMQATGYSVKVTGVRVGHAIVRAWTLAYGAEPFGHGPPHRCRCWLEDMMNHHTLQTPVLIAATVATGLSAGLFYGYACSVMPGLARAEDRTFIDAMQRINVAILNGWFALVFAGALLLAVLAGALHLRGAGRPALPWIVAAVVLYLVMLVITIRVNVPLNNALADAGHPDRITDLSAVREQFEARWVRWNIVRAVTSTAAFGLLVCALATTGRGLPRGSA